MKREEYEGFGPAIGVGEGIGCEEIDWDLFDVRPDI